MRKIFISAGHSNRPGRDRGASATHNGVQYIEGVLAVEFRALVVAKLQAKGIEPIVDDNDSILSQTIAKFRNLTTNRCIVVEYHWNAAANPAATGTETLIPVGPTDFEIDLAAQLSEANARLMKIPLRGVTRNRRGVKTELESARRTLGWMRLTGQNILPEMCFISNARDMEAYEAAKDFLAQAHADILEFFAKV